MCPLYFIALFYFAKRVSAKQGLTLLNEYLLNKDYGKRKFPYNKIIIYYSSIFIKTKIFVSGIAYRALRKKRKDSEKK
ncbi:MAG TPA: hypothetical protein DCK79_10290 [Candidatus Atribacteria bacterium]|nr:hypothetical protein [Candidatus Atribacteria bacterium]